MVSSRSQAAAVVPDLRTFLSFGFGAKRPAKRSPAKRVLVEEVVVVVGDACSEAGALGRESVRREEDAERLEGIGLAVAGGGERPRAEPRARKVALAWADDGASRAPPAKPGEAG